MKQITFEWVTKAEGDFAMMERESRARKNPNYDGLCFHAQQSLWLKVSSYGEHAGDQGIQQAG